MPSEIKPDTKLNENTLMLDLHLGRVTNRKKIDSDSEWITTEIDRDLLHLSKTLFDAPELKTALGYLNALRAALRRRAVPSYFRGGMYLVKFEAFEAVDNMLELAVEEFKPLVQAFADVVELRKEESRIRLKEAFVDGEFPTASQVIEAFSIKWSWQAWSTPTSIKKFNMHIYEREVKKAEEGVQAVVTNIENLLLAETKKILDDTVERMKPGDDGKVKTLRSTKNIVKFLSDFPFKNVIDSATLDEQVTKMALLMDGVDTDSLKSNERLREDVLKGFSEVQLSVNTLIENRPKRLMDLG